MRKKRIITCLLACLFALFCAARAGETREVYVLATNGSAVLADEAGAVLIPPGQYAEIAPLGDSGLFAARRLSGGGLGVIRADGSAVTGFHYGALEYDGARIIFSADGKCGAMTLEGGGLIEPVYTRLISAGEGSLAFKTNPLDDTPDALWRVSESGEEHLTGLKLSFGPLAMSEGLSEAADALGRWGYVGADGGWAIEPTFAWCGPFRDGLARAAADEGMGLIDRGGEWIVAPDYRRIERGASGRPFLAFEDGALSLLDAMTGEPVARFEGEAVDAGYAGGLIRVSAGGALTLVDDRGEVVSEAPEGAVGLTESGGCVIVQRAFSDERPFSLIGADGTAHGDWRELTAAGSYGGRAYFIFSDYEAVRSEYAAQGVVFHDEVAGTRRYGILDDAGGVVLDGLISLRRTGRALLTAEAEDWVGLIRPDGTVIMKLEKAE